MGLCRSRTAFCLASVVVTALWLTLFAGLPTKNAFAQEAPKAAVEQAEQPDETPQTKSRVAWFLESSGWIGAFILLLSIYFIALVVRLFVELRPEVAMPPRIIEQCNSLFEHNDFRGIANMAAGDDSLFSVLVTAGLTELPEGVSKSRDAMERVNDVKTAELEKKISMLAVLGTLGPMIGLLGTLKGMIAAFSVIAMSDTQLRTSEVAAGISQALLLTFEGVALSVPAIYFFAFFRNRVMLIAAETLLRADELMRRIAKAARSRSAAAGV